MISATFTATRATAALLHPSAKHMLLFGWDPDIRPFNCSICKRSFRQEGQLKVHNRIHTGEKPFKCYLCQRKFRHKSSYNLHITTTGCVRGLNTSLAMGTGRDGGGRGVGVNEDLAILPHHTTSGVALRSLLEPPSGRKRLATQEAGVNANLVGIRNPQVMAARRSHANQPSVGAQYSPPAPSLLSSSPAPLAGPLLPAPPPPSSLLVRRKRLLDIDAVLSLHNTSRHPNASVRAFSALPEKNVVLLSPKSIGPGVGRRRGGRHLKTLSSSLDEKSFQDGFSDDSAWVSQEKRAKITAV